MKCKFGGNMTSSASGNVFRIVAFIAVIGLHFGLVVAQAPPPTDADCTSDVPFADTENCTCYYQCFNVNSAWMLVHLDCPSGGIWDNVNQACVEGTCAAPTTTTEATTTPTTPTTTIAPTTTTPPAAEATTPAASTAAPVPGSSTVADPSTTTASTATTSTATTSAGASSTASTATSSQTDATTTVTTVTSGPPTFICTAVGFFAHPTDPAKYYQCVLIGAQFYYYIYTCPPSACFQQSAGTCVVGTCSSTNTTVGPPGTTSPPVDIICNSQGQYPFPGSCTKYYNCILLDDGFVYYVFECPPASYFNAATGLCTTGQCPSTSPTTTTIATTAVTTPSTTTTTTAVAPTTTAASPDHPCPTEGYFADPSDCQAYYRCIIMSGQMYRYMFRCPAGAYWNSSMQGCIVGACPTTQGGNVS